MSIPIINYASLPAIKYYAKMTYTGTTSTPKYVVTSSTGDYPPMEALVGKDGKISMYLVRSIKEGENTPNIRLQAKNSLNFTGLKHYFVDGQLTGAAYGYPPKDKFYSKKNIPNPFYEYREDGFLFIIDFGDDVAGLPQSAVPQTIELMVLDRAKPLIGDYCRSLLLGGFNAEIARLRDEATRYVLV